MSSNKQCKDTQFTHWMRTRVPWPHNLNTSYLLLMQSNKMEVKLFRESHCGALDQDLDLFKLLGVNDSTHAQTQIHFCFMTCISEDYVFIKGSFIAAFTEQKTLTFKYSWNYWVCEGSTGSDQWWEVSVHDDQPQRIISPATPRCGYVHSY